jgi:hypothetical protein
MLLLRNKYKYLNCELESSALTPCNVTNLKSCSRNCMIPRENNTHTVKPSVTELRDSCMSSRRQHLRNLRIIYSQPHDVAVLTNSAYGISLLCSTVWVLIYIISAANRLIEQNNADIELNIFLVLTMSTFFLAPLTIMAVYASLAAKEYSHSLVIVQIILLRVNVDSEVMRELEKMFTQFKAMEIEFSACGMYKIDLSVISDIFGTTLSYIIIFSQL